MNISTKDSIVVLTVEQNGVVITILVIDGQVTTSVAYVDHRNAPLKQ
jgi:hypothetical protein